MKSNLLPAHTTAQFNGVVPERLYQVYTDAHEHALATGQPATVDPREGCEFSACGGYLTGKFIRLVPGQLVIQYWRSRHFADADPDSINFVAFRRNEYERAEAELLLTTCRTG